ncbi:MAG: hypothetical protein V4673_14495 [Pseudomonadota bacterium]
MNDDRPYADRRGDYAAAKFGDMKEPKLPQDFKDWQSEFDHVVKPGLERSRAMPEVRHGLSHIKGSR